MVAQRNATKPTNQPTNQPTTNNQPLVKLGTYHFQQHGRTSTRSYPSACRAQLLKFWSKVMLQYVLVLCY